MASPPRGEGVRPMRSMARRVSAGLAVVLLAAACTGGNDEPSDTSPDTDTDTTEGEEVEGLQDAQDLVSSYPREETVFTSGTQWGPPSSWNPIPQTGDATGTRGLLYEPL